MGERGPGVLLVKADGTVMDGNTRIAVSKGRGVDVDSLPLVPYVSPLPPEWVP